MSDRCPDCARADKDPRCWRHRIDPDTMDLIAGLTALAIALLLIFSVASLVGCSDRHEITRPHRPIGQDPVTGVDTITFAGTKWHDRSRASDPACPLHIFDDNTLQLTVPYSVQVADTGLFKYARGYAVFQASGVLPPTPNDSVVVGTGLYGSHWISGGADPRSGTVRLVFSWRTPIFREVVYEESTGHFVSLYDTLPAWTVAPPQISGAEADKQVRVLTEVR